MFVPNYSKARKLQLSNDAFYCLAYDEPCLDEANLEEAKTIQAIFPNGFLIQDDWKEIPESGLIEATLVPYEESLDSEKYDLVFEASECYHLRITWLTKTTVKVRRYNPYCNSSEYLGEFDVKENSFGNKYFNLGGSIIFFKRLKKATQ